jgi:hypothetical protein
MEPNFIILPGSSPESALAALWSAFPELRKELDDGDSEAYYIYGLFADYLASHIGDDRLWQRAYRLFDSLAVGGEYLQTILVVQVFEALCSNPAVAACIKSNVGPAALELFQDTQSFWNQPS